MPLSGSVESIVATIRDEVGIEVERIEKAAAEESASQRALLERVPGVPADREQRLAVARRQNAEALAQAEWEARRAFIEERERWIDAVVACGREMLKAMPLDARLSAEALAGIGDPHAEIVLAPGGGCMARAGNLVVDNSFDERARRFESVWRAALAERYRA